jgi:hypothetical protein
MLIEVAIVRSIRELRLGDTRWQRFCDRLTDAILFAAGQGGTGYLTHEDIYDALEDVLSDDFAPDKLEHLADLVLKARQ